MSEPVPQEKNIEEFNRDVEVGGGYVYTERGGYSSQVSNQRLT